MMRFGRRVSVSTAAGKKRASRVFFKSSCLEVLASDKEVRESRIESCTRATEDIASKERSERPDREFFEVRSLPRCS
jgi:hypothetical protein